MNSSDIRFTQNIEHGLRVSRKDSFAFIHENESIKFWVHWDNCRATQDMRFEHASIPKIKKHTKSEITEKTPRWRWKWCIFWGGVFEKGSFLMCHGENEEFLRWVFQEDQEKGWLFVNMCESWILNLGTHLVWCGKVMYYLYIIPVSISSRNQSEKWNDTFLSWVSQEDEEKGCFFMWRNENKEKERNLALWFFMKLGPCLRKSVVSPKSGQPMVPGGRPFFLYFISFHLKRKVLKRQSPNTTPIITVKIAMDALSSKLL